MNTSPRAQKLHQFCVFLFRVEGRLESVPACIGLRPDKHLVSPKVHKQREPAKTHENKMLNIKAKLIRIKNIWSLFSLGYLLFKKYHEIKLATTLR